MTKCVHTVEHVVKNLENQVILQNFGYVMAFAINGITVHVKAYTDHLPKTTIYAECVNNSVQTVLLQNSCDIYSSCTAR